MTNACCTHSNVVNNSEVTEPNLTKFMHDIEKLYGEIGIAILQSISERVPNEGVTANIAHSTLVMCALLDQILPNFYTM